MLSLEAGKFWEMLQGVAKPTLSDVFGVDLKPRGRGGSYAVDKGQGIASLGCLVLQKASNPHLYIDHGLNERKIRLQFIKMRTLVNLGVTDIRLYADDFLEPDPIRVSKINLELKSLFTRQGVILALGLSRALGDIRGEYPPVHWLQVNNIHLKTNPIWQLG